MIFFHLWLKLLFHNKEWCGEKMWVNIIFPKCDACLLKSDIFKGILDNSKSQEVNPSKFTQYFVRDMVLNRLRLRNTFF